MSPAYRHALSVSSARLCTSEHPKILICLSIYPSTPHPRLHHTPFPHGLSIPMCLPHTVVRSCYGAMSTLCPFHVCHAPSLLPNHDPCRNPIRRKLHPLRLDTHARGIRPRGLFQHLFPTPATGFPLPRLSACPFPRTHLDRQTTYGMYMRPRLRYFSFLISLSLPLLAATVLASTSHTLSHPSSVLGHGATAISIQSTHPPL